jgi:hypothetical protein
MTLVDQQDLAEITHPDYPGERLVGCCNPLLAAERTSQTRGVVGRDRGGLTDK